MNSFSYLEPVCCSMSSSNCWLPDLHIGFARGWSSGLVFPSLSEFSTVCCDPHSQRFWHSQKAKIDVFLELFCFFHDPADVGNLISGSSAFSKTRLNIRKFTVHILLKPGLENFKRYSTSVWDECNCASKFGKLSSGHRTGKGQFSFQSQRKAMLKNAQTTAQLYSSHTLVK